MNSTDEDPEIIRQTVASKVLFAGEATCYKYQGSLQGAYVSGTLRSNQSDADANELTDL